MTDQPTDRPTLLTAINALQEEVKLTNFLIEDLIKLNKQLIEERITQLRKEADDLEKTLL